MGRELEIKQVMLLDSFQLVRTKLNEFMYLICQKGLKTHDSMCIVLNNR